MIVNTGAQGAVMVTPNDGANIVFPKGTTETKWLFVGVTGNVNAIMADGSTATFTGLLTGTIYPLCVKRILATDTTATSIVALY